MSDARLKALEAVAEAAFAWWRRAPDDEWKREKALGDTLRTLAALPAQPQPQPAGEGVEMAVCISATGAVLLSVAGSEADTSAEVYWRRLGTVTLPLTVEPGA